MSKQYCGTVTISYGSFPTFKVPVPYLDHKKHFRKTLEKILPFYIVSFFTRQK
jgi:hypothetical protein